MNNQGDFLQRLYRMRIIGLEAYRNNVWKILCTEYFSRFISKKAHVLDLGAGWCEFINNVNAEKKYAMDLNPETGSRLEGDAQFLHQDCSQDWNIRSESLDVVFTSNFFEHLPDKPSIERAVSEAYRCLKSDGAIICVGPNVKYAPGAYWDFWDHHIPLTETSLAEVLELRGFNVQVRIARFLPFSMSTGVTPPLFLLQLYLRMPFFWQFIGKQFLVVARK